MKYKFLTNVNYEGVYYTEGDEIELDDAAAEAIKKLIEPVEKVPEETPEEVPEGKSEEVDYSEKTVRELKKIAEKRDIDVKGLKKDEIIEALEE